MGLAADLAAGTIILRALVVMLVCWFVGQIIGAVADRVVEIQIKEYIEEHPLPSLEPEGRQADEQESSVDIVENESVVQV